MYCVLLKMHKLCYCKNDSLSLEEYNHKKVMWHLCRTFLVYFNACKATKHPSHHHCTVCALHSKFRTLKKSLSQPGKGWAYEWAAMVGPPNTLLIITNFLNLDQLISQMWATACLMSQFTYMLSAWPEDTSEELKCLVHPYQSNQVSVQQIHRKQPHSHKVSKNTNKSKKTWQTTPREGGRNKVILKRTKLNILNGGICFCGKSECHKHTRISDISFTTYQTKEALYHCNFVKWPKTSSHH